MLILLSDYAAAAHYFLYAIAFLYFRFLYFLMMRYLLSSLSSLRAYLIRFSFTLFTDAFFATAADIFAITTDVYLTLSLIIVIADAAIYYAAIYCHYLHFDYFICCRRRATPPRFHRFR